MAVYIFSFKPFGLVFSMWASFKVAYIPSVVGRTFYKDIFTRECVCKSVYIGTYRGGALDDVATVVALAGHQAEPLAGVLVLA